MRKALKAFLSSNRKLHFAVLIFITAVLLLALPPFISLALGYEQITILSGGEFVALCIGIYTAFAGSNAYITRQYPERETIIEPEA